MHSSISRLKYAMMNEPHAIMLIGPPAAGKALSLDTPIPTPSGWKNIGELSVGDKVFDENGLPCNVVGVSPIWKNRTVCSVITDSKETIIADTEHEWLARQNYWNAFKIITTKDLISNNRKRPMILQAKPLQLPSVNLPIEPYLLGIWLGDGASSGVRVTSDTNDQIFVRSEIEKLGYKTTDQKEILNFGIPGIRKKFISLGLLNVSSENIAGRKHIPAQYLRANIEQRISLLQGLIDTDGHVNKKGHVVFYNMNKELVLNVLELVRTLGVKANFGKKNATINGKDHGICYWASFYHERAARLPRKAKFCRNNTRLPNTYIRVEPNGVADTVCIQVDSASHMFLCGRNMLPTHNSTWIKENNVDHVIISTDDIIDAWASAFGTTYSVVWHLFFKEAETQMKIDFQKAVAENKNIIIDRTNMSKNVRHKFLCNIPKHYSVYGIVFTVDRAELERRCLLRPGKDISSQVLDDMLARYEEPTTDEFKEVFHANSHS